jgi:hypothetical protein
MALESFPKISPANFSPENDLIQVYSKKGDYVGVINPSYISISANPSGVAGAIQFSNGSAFASDAANLFWDDTNNRLGIGTNAPAAKFQVSSGSTGIMIDFGGSGDGNNYIDAGSSNSGFTYLRCRTETSGPLAVNFVNGYASAMLAVKGNGSTSATTSLLVQNSAGTEVMRVRDDGFVLINNTLAFTSADYGSLGLFAAGVWTFNGGGINDTPRINWGGYTSSFPAIKRASNNIEIKNADDTFGAGLSVGGALVTSAILQADSTTKGFLPPRMTTTQINAIVSPANGLEVYNTTLACPCFYDGIAWRKVSHTTM